MTRDYDTTLARMAGNIAAGLVEPQRYYSSDAARAIAECSIAIARAIIDQCREAAPKPTVMTFMGETPEILGMMPCHTPACGWNGRTGSMAAVVRFLGATRLWCKECKGCWGVSDQELRERLEKP